MTITLISICLTRWFFVLLREELELTLKRERRMAEKSLARSKKMVCFNCRQPGDPKQIAGGNSSSEHIKRKLFRSHACGLSWCDWEWGESRGTQCWPVLQVWESWTFKQVLITSSTSFDWFFNDYKSEDVLNIFTGIPVFTVYQAQCEMKFKKITI